MLGIQMKEAKEGEKRYYIQKLQEESKARGGIGERGWLVGEVTTRSAGYQRTLQTIYVVSTVFNFFM